MVDRLFRVGARQEEAEALVVIGRSAGVSVPDPLVGATLDLSVLSASGTGCQVLGGHGFILQTR